MEGLERSYQRYGVTGARREEYEHSSEVSLFWVGFDAEGNVVAGQRVHGPLDGIHQVSLLDEMAGSSEIDLIRDEVESYIPGGLLECKGAWSDGEAKVGARFVQASCRMFAHANNWLGTRATVVTCADRLFPNGPGVTGATQIGSEFVPYPDERYRTGAAKSLVDEYWEQADEEHREAYQRESAELAQGPTRVDETLVEMRARTKSYHPLVLDPLVRSHVAVMNVIKNDPTLEVIDHLSEQRAQLSTVIPKVHERGGEKTRWVYYPWRHSLVNLLAPRDFSALRLDRNRNRITKEEQGRLRRLSIGVVGLSAGHVIAYTLALEGLVGELRLADFDTVELTNLNRIPGTVLDIGVNKAVVAARRISELDPYLKVTIQTDGVSKENLPEFLSGLSLVVEECDSIDMKFLVREFARAREIPVIMETSDRGLLDVERYDLEPERALFHGLLGNMDSASLEGLSLAQKSPIVIKLIGAKDASSRGAASLIEVGTTITGWPQLGSDVTMGGVSVAAAVRRFGLGGDLPSGRVRFDVEEILDALAPADLDFSLEEGMLTPPPEDPLLISNDPVLLIVDAARRAPSGGNVQPWRFEADESEIRFYMTGEHTTAMDVKYRGTLAGVGAGILNARVRASALHKLGAIEYFPEGHASKLVAKMQLGEGRDVGLLAYDEYIHTRSANRRIGRPESISPEVMSTLHQSVEREGAKLHLITERDQINASADLLAQSDRMRFLLPTVHREMLSELHWPGRDSLEEGLDVRSMEMDPGSLAAVSILGREDVMAHLADWRAGDILGLRTQAAIQTSSALAVITVPGTSPEWYVKGGAAMERFWLSTERLGMAVCPTSPVFLYATNEEELAELSGERYFDEMSKMSKKLSELWNLAPGEAQIMVFRIFQAPPPSVHSIRLPLDYVLARDK
jgi:molybdopterin/thiamine biosynthesis adenylyltransferase/nitroreductase